MTINIREAHELIQALELNEALILLVKSLKDHNYSLTNQLLVSKPELREAPFGKTAITPLLMMLIYNPECEEAIFRQLMQLPRSINAQNKDGMAVIHVIAQNNRADLLSILLEREDVDINLKTTEQASALAVAAYHGHSAIVNLLIEKGANLREKNGPSAIHRACMMAKLASVQALLNKDPNLIAYRDHLGKTPAHYLASTKSENHQEILEIIKLFSNEQLAQECRDHTTPFETARYFKHETTAQIIKSRQLLSLYQLCQNQLCKEEPSSFQEITSLLSTAPHISHVLIKKKSRMV